MIFLKFRSLISRNWGFLENCFSISRFSFFSLVGLFFSIKTNNSNFNTSFIIHLYHREQIVQHKKEVVVFLCLVDWSLRHRGLKSKIYHQFLHSKLLSPLGIHPFRLSHLTNRKLCSSIPQCLHRPFFHLEEIPILLP